MITQRTLKDIEQDIGLLKCNLKVYWRYRRSPGCRMSMKLMIIRIRALEVSKYVMERSDNPIYQVKNT